MTVSDYWRIQELNPQDEIEPLGQARRLRSQGRC
jgi:hypothetical protein